MCQSEKSSLCVAGRSSVAGSSRVLQVAAVIFGEVLQYCGRQQERGLSSLLAEYSTCCRLPKKARKNSSLEEDGINVLCPLIGQCVAESLGGGIDLQEKIDLWLLQYIYIYIYPFGKGLLNMCKNFLSVQCSYIYIYIYTHTHTHTYLYIYIYTWSSWLCLSVLSIWNLWISKQLNIKSCNLIQKFTFQSILFLLYDRYTAKPKLVKRNLTSRQIIMS